MTSPRSLRLVMTSMVVTFVIVSPYLGIARWRPSLAVFIWISAIAAVGLNLMFGYTGMLSLGNAVFLGASAYTMGLLHHHLAIPVPVAALAGILATTALALVVGFVFVRIPGVYFAVGTLGLAVAFEGLIRAFPSVTGGASGLTIARQLDFWFITISDDLAWYVLTTILALAVGLLAYYLATGRTGRILHLVRHDQLAASVFGVDVPRTKLVIFVISGFVTSTAGLLLFLWQGVVVPEMAGLLESVELVAITVVGGAGSWVGPFVGAFLVESVNDGVRRLGQYREIFFGAVFLFVVLFARGGVVGLIARARSAIAHRATRRGGRSAGDPDRPVVRASTRARAAAAAGSPSAALRQGRDGSQAEGGLEVLEVTKRFGGLTAVSRASLVVPDAAVVGLIGSNGAGKSTLMNIISGIETPDEGTVMLSGKDVGGLTPAERARRGLARTFQTPRLVPNLSVLSNVCLGADAAHERPFRRHAGEESQTVEAAHEALKIAELDHLSHRRAHELGSGERKFVELVRALAWRPSVLLMDEPAVGLIDDEIELLLRWVAGLREAGTTILLVDHNMDFIGEVADHVYLMAQGGIVAAGEPGEIVELLKTGASFHDEGTLDT